MIEKSPSFEGLFVYISFGIADYVTIFIDINGVFQDNPAINGTMSYTDKPRTGSGNSKICCNAITGMKEPTT